MDALLTIANFWLFFWFVIRVSCVAADCLEE